MELLSQVPPAFVVQATLVADCGVIVVVLIPPSSVALCTGCHGVKNRCAFY